MKRSRIAGLLSGAVLTGALVTGSVAGPVSPAAAHVPAGATTAAKVVYRSPNPPPVVVTARAGRHTGYDRFVIEMRGKATGYRIRYVTTPRYDASGRRIPIYGKAYLLIILTPATAHTSKGVTYTGPRRIVVGLPTIHAFAFAGDFESHVSFALALNKKARFHVGELSNPRRLYIDLAH